MTHPTIQNHLLNALSNEDLAQLQPHLQPMTVHLGQVLIPPHQPIDQLFFPLSGFASVTNDDSDKIEVGIIGSEGLVGVAVLLGSDRTPLDHFVQAPGEVLCIDADAFRAAVDRSASMRNLFLRFVQTLLVQTAQTAFTNASFGIEARLARWLLMCQDRLGTDSLVLTHEFLSMMLGVQRTSVTLALQALEENGLIRARRGRVEVRSREKLKELADVSYGVAEAEYTRLISRL
jgi:CRP-like cAMP-binding protein